MHLQEYPCASRLEDYFPCPTQNYSKIGYFSKNMDNLRFNSHIFHNNPFLIINNYFDCTYSIIEQKKKDLQLSYECITGGTDTHVKIKNDETKQITIE